MTQSLNATERKEVEALVKRLEAAWNAGDGTAFAAEMALDADFVTIRAEHFHGREPIAAGHNGIFRSIYAGSTNHYTVESVRQIRPDVAVVHVQARLDVPAGPLAGKHAALFSAVLVRESGGWQVVSFHNTLAR
jgi:uncharacterized protein (TIGR02246 family)